MTDTSLPKIDLNIQSTPISAKSRKLKFGWSQEAADDLRDLWGLPRPRLPSNALDLLNDSLEDPNFDPNSPEPYKGLYRWPDGRVATPEEIKEAFESAPESALVEKMAIEITAEIDREILKDLRRLAK